MDPQERKDFWKRMNDGYNQSKSRHWDPEAFGLRNPRPEEFEIQPVAPDCPLDGHSHEPGQFCQGCADLTGYVRPDSAVSALMKERNRIIAALITNFSIVQTPPPSRDYDVLNLTVEDVKLLTSMGIEVS